MSAYDPLGPVEREVMRVELALGLFSAGVITGISLAIKFLCGSCS